MTREEQRRDRIDKMNKMGRGQLLAIGYQLLADG